MSDETLMRREDDRTMGRVLAKLESLDERMETLEAQIQDFRDVKNRGVGILLVLGTVLPAVGAFLWSLVKGKIGINIL